MKSLCFEGNATLSLSAGFDTDREWTALVSWRAGVSRTLGPLITVSDTVVSARDERK